MNRSTLVNANKLAYKIQRTIDSPCWNCNERTESCHGTCKRYSEYRETLHQKKTEVYKAHQAERMVEKYVVGEMVKNKQSRESGKMYFNKRR